MLTAMSTRTALPSLLPHLLLGMALAWAMAGCATQADDPAGSTPPRTATAPACNGDARLCDRRLDEVVLATAHNAMSSAADGWFFANQPSGLLAQLDAGLRGFMLDVHPYDGNDESLTGQPHLCHATCKLGAQSLPAGLTALRQWLDAHPREVVVLIFEDYISAAQLADGFAQAGLTTRLAVLDVAQPLPTLRKLIDAQTTVVVMTESGSGQLPWNHAYQGLAFDTPYSAEYPADLRCEVGRGKITNRLMVLNHFLTRGLQPHDKLAAEINHNPGLLQRVLDCQTKLARKVNLVAVDWYSEGDVVAAVRTLNGLDGGTGGLP